MNTKNADYQTINRLEKKLCNQDGETISETLVALLIAALALVMLAGAVSVAKNIIENSRTRVGNYYAANEELVNLGSSEDPAGSLAPDAGSGGEETSAQENQSGSTEDTGSEQGSNAGSGAESGSGSGQESTPAIQTGTNDVSIKENDNQLFSIKVKCFRNTELKKTVIAYKLDQ